MILFKKLLRRKWWTLPDQTKLYFYESTSDCNRHSLFFGRIAFHLDILFAWKKIEKNWQKSLKTLLLKKINNQTLHEVTLISSTVVKLDFSTLAEAKPDEDNTETLEWDDWSPTNFSSKFFWTPEWSDDSAVDNLWCCCCASAASAEFTIELTSLLNKCECLKI